MYRVPASLAKSGWTLRYDNKDGDQTVVIPRVYILKRVLKEPETYINPYLYRPQDSRYSRVSIILIKKSNKTFIKFPEEMTKEMID